MPFSRCWAEVVLVFLLFLLLLQSGILIYYIRKNHALAKYAIEMQKRIFDHAEKVHRMVNSAIGEDPPPTIGNPRDSRPSSREQLSSSRGPDLRGFEPEE